MSRARWSGAAVLALLAASLFLGVTVWLMGGLRAAQAAAEMAVAAGQRPGLSGPSAHSASTPWVLPVGQPDVARLAAVAPADAQRLLRPDEFDLCGLGIRQGRLEPEPEREVPPSDQERAALQARGPNYQLPADIEQHLKDQVYAPLLATMARSPDVRQQAAGLWLGGQQPKLVELARTSSDPLVMLWAQRTCQGQRQQGACAGLSARHWVRIEPDNLIAWLLLLNEEPVALDEALHGMAQAKRADAGFMRILETLDAALPDSLKGYEAAWVIDRIVGVEAAQVGPAYQGLLKACGIDAVRSANRRQTCEALGRVMAEHASDSLARTMGSHVLDWAEGSTARVVSMRQRWTAMTEANVSPWIDPQPYSCAATHKRRQWARQLGRQGEWAYYMAQMEARQRQAVGVAR